MGYNNNNNNWIFICSEHLFFQTFWRFWRFRLVFAFDLIHFFPDFSILGIAVECGYILPKRVLGIFLHPLEHCTQALIFDFVANRRASVCLFLDLQTLFLQVCAISIPPWNWGHLIISIRFRIGFCGTLSDLCYNLPIELQRFTIWCIYQQFVQLSLRTDSSWLCLLSISGLGVVVYIQHRSDRWENGHSHVSPHPPPAGNPEVLQLSKGTSQWLRGCLFGCGNG